MEGTVLVGNLWEIVIGRLGLEIGSSIARC